MPLFSGNIEAPRDQVNERKQPLHFLRLGPATGAREGLITGHRK